MASSQSFTPPSALESVVITSFLEHRPARIPDIQRENDSIRELAEIFATDPDRLLDRTVEMALRLCDADTVGISVEQTNDESEQIFRWVALAGELKDLIGGTTPRHFSPCGICVDQKRPLLMHELDRAYPYFKAARLPFVEALLVPWGLVDGKMGTLWAVAHSDRRKFDREDVRVMGWLAAFAAGAIQVKETLLDTQRAAALAHVVAEMAHRINNPLQGAMLALFHAKSRTDTSAGVREMLVIVENQLQRVAELSAALLEPLNVQLAAADNRREKAEQDNAGLQDHRGR